MAKQKNKISTKRIEQILDAALSLALTVGLKSTTMEAIAKQAEISKATLYKYFPDKQAIFRAISARLFLQLEKLVIAGLAKEKPLDERIALALSEKNKAVFRLFEGSPHKEEIFSEKSKFASKEVEQFENWLTQKIAYTLLKGGQQEPQKYAQILIACCEGISKNASNASQIGPAIRLVVRKILQ